MRVRVELIEERGMTTYQVAQAVAATGAVSVQAVYRLVRAGGRVKRIDARLLGALLYVLEAGVDELLVRDDEDKPPRPAKRRAKKRR